ncbi:MAG TPA: PetM family of cytochrome b6f complex subunit 7 [Microvirga sp.]|nr:PetM family of cytochrome b6f complex subunit 7 [Microvirga sp.]
MKFLARSLGLVLVAAGFVGLVIDGTRSIVNNSISFGSIAGLLGTLAPGSVTGLESQIAQRSYGWIWDPVVAPLLQLPASVTAFVLGAVLLWLGQKSAEPIGYLAGR